MFVSVATAESTITLPEFDACAGGRKLYYFVLFLFFLFHCGMKMNKPQQLQSINLVCGRCSYMHKLMASMLFVFWGVSVCRRRCPVASQLEHIDDINWVHRAKWCAGYVKVIQFVYANENEHILLLLLLGSNEYACCMPTA